MAVPANPPSPTFNLSGVYLRNILDFTITLQACFDGKLNTYTRPKDKTGIATSGSVYILERRSSGTAGRVRWTDDKSWSQSRSVHNSLLYRERAQAGEETMSSTDRHGPQETHDKIPTGNHTDTTEFKKDGLVKRTMTFRFPLEGKEYLVVNYYSLNLTDENGLPLQQPIDMPYLHGPLRQDFASSYYKVPFMDEIKKSDTARRYRIYEERGWLDCFKNSPSPQRPPSPQRRRQNHSSSQHQPAIAQHPSATGVPMSAGQFTSYPNLHASHAPPASGQPPMTYTGPNAYGSPPGNPYAGTHPFQAQPQQVPVYPQGQTWTNMLPQTAATPSDPNDSNPGASGTPYAPPAISYGENMRSSQATFGLNFNNPGPADIAYPLSDDNEAFQDADYPNLFDNPDALGTLYASPSSTSGQSIESFQAQYDLNLVNNCGPTYDPYAPSDNSGANNGSFQLEVPVDPNLFNQGTLGTPNAPPPDTSGQPEIPRLSQSNDSPVRYVTLAMPERVPASGGTEHLHNGPDEYGYNPVGDAQNY
ncbi:hypothetical protein V8F06_011832 [Rhypophila decipiens]